MQAVSGDSCAAAGLVDITNTAECNQAALELGLKYLPSHPTLQALTPADYYYAIPRGCVFRGFQYLIINTEAGAGYAPTMPTPT